MNPGLRKPKFEARNPKLSAQGADSPLCGSPVSKWFDRLTTLSEVEGQYKMTKVQMTKIE
jgi:hypothetical protein